MKEKVRRKVMRCGGALIMTLAMFLGLLVVPAKEVRAAGDISLTVGTIPSVATEDTQNNSSNADVYITNDSGYSNVAALYAAGYKSLSVTVTLAGYKSWKDEQVGIMPYIITGDKWNNFDVWENVSATGTYTVVLPLDSLSMDTSNIARFGVQVANITGAVNISSVSATLIHTGSGGGSGVTPGVIDGTKEYNFAKLLQYSLYFYDANMCGYKPSSSLCEWRGNCHTADKFTYGGKTYDAYGGYHDAGDHVKFGLPMAYSMSVLGLGYYENKDVYDELGQTGHLKNIVDYGLDYFKRCTVWNSSNTSVEAFCYQIGSGDADHKDWSVPEGQSSRTESTYIATSSNPATDVVSETAAAFAIHYLNFGQDEDLKYAKALFDFSKNHTKSCGKYEPGNGDGFYASKSWADDYCLAAAMLYKAAVKTGDTSAASAYKAEFDKCLADQNVYCGYVMSWDDVKALVSLYIPEGYTDRVSSLSSYIDGQATSTNSYYCLMQWGSARYNMNLQFMALCLDKHNGTNKYLNWATYQTSMILGNNDQNQSLIIGYGSNYPQNPHHRAASNGHQSNSASGEHMLLGALVGGPSGNSFSTYEDNINNYTTNEVACDYNAAVPGVAAFLYKTYKNSDTEGFSSQTVDENYYNDGGAGPQPVDPTKIDISSATVTLSPSSYEFDNTAKNPTPTVILNGTTLSASTDYTVSYSNNKGVGTSAKVTVTGKGSYKGTVSKTFEIKHTNHTYSNNAWTTVTSAKCDTDGEKRCYCDYRTTAGCLQYKSETILKTGHDYSAGFNWSDNGTTCSVTLTCKNDSNHKLSNQTATVTEQTGDSIAATCDSAGKRVYKASYSYNGKSYNDTKTVTIPSLGHSYAYNTNGTWSGDYETCSFHGVCTRNSSHTKDVPAKVTKNSADATCTTIGTVTYTAKATIDGTQYTDSKQKSGVVLGHDYKAAYQWTADGTGCTVVLACQRTNCNDRVENQTASVVEDTSQYVAPKCNATGKKVYKATLNYNGKVYTGSKTITLDRLAHSYTKKTVSENALKSEATTTSPAVYYYSCSGCGAVNKADNAPTFQHGSVLQEKYYPVVDVSYKTHVQSFGWQSYVKNGVMSGTSGKAKRLEGIQIQVASAEAGKTVDLGIQYTTHCQSYGWLPWSSNDDMNGTEGEAKRLEAIMIKLTGADKNQYDVYYRVHAQSYGWLGWAKNGEPSGTAGFAKRLEGIQIVVVKKGTSAPGISYAGINGTNVKYPKAYYAKAGSSPIVNYPATSNTNPVVPGDDMITVAYRTHVQSIGWQGWKFNGQMSGTSGMAKRLEGIEIKLNNKAYSGDIVYTTHVQSYGWQGNENSPSTWKKNGEMSGTKGQAKRLEAIRISLTGEMAQHYDIYYRVHAQSYGWLGWAKNGEASGTAGYAKRLEGIQIVLVPKGGSAPAVNYGGITSVRSQAYVKK